MLIKMLETFYLKKNDLFFEGTQTKNVRDQHTTTFSILKPLYLMTLDFMFFWVN